MQGGYEPIRISLPCSDRNLAVHDDCVGLRRGSGRLIDSVILDAKCAHKPQKRLRLNVPIHGGIERLVCPSVSGAFVPSAFQSCRGSLVSKLRAVSGRTLSDYPPALLSLPPGRSLPESCVASKMLSIAMMEKGSTICTPSSCTRVDAHIVCGVCLHARGCVCLFARDWVRVRA